MVQLRTRQQGSTLIEVLVTIVILAIGLLALAALQMRLQMSEQESYQRSQAITLLQDMASRIEANRRNAASYVIGLTATGAGVTCPTDVSTRAKIDLGQWCLALQGAAESFSNNKAGAMIGGRGCIETVPDGYMVTVAWQGQFNLGPPPSSVACGKNAYDDTKNCTADGCRRAVTTVVTVGSL